VLNDQLAELTGIFRIDFESCKMNGYLETVPIRSYI